jgi:hypothetical protein
MTQPPVTVILRRSEGVRDFGGQTHLDLVGHGLDRFHALRGRFGLELVEVSRYRPCQGHDATVCGHHADLRCIDALIKPQFAQNLVL